MLSSTIHIIYIIYIIYVREKLTERQKKIQEIALHSTSHLSSTLIFKNLSIYFQRLFTKKQIYRHYQQSFLTIFSLNFNNLNNVFLTITSSAFILNNRAGTLLHRKDSNVLTIRFSSTDRQFNCGHCSIWERERWRERERKNG